MSAVIPTRDRWPLLRRALVSVLAQEGVALEAIVVDDGSRDGTPERLRALGDPRVSVIAPAMSGGVARARNRGIAAARGRLVAFLDDDDVWAPHKLRAQLARAAPGVTLVYTGALVLDHAGRVLRERRTAPVGELDPGLFATNLVGSPSTVLAPTDVLRRLGGFDEALAALADWDLWLRLLAEGRPAVCPEPLAGYTVHPGNMHVGDPAGLRRELRVMRARHGAAAAARGVELAGPPFRRWLVRRYRDAGLRREAARLYLALGFRERTPRDLGRALGVLLGERALRLGAPRGSGLAGAPPPLPPAWLLALENE